MAASFLITLREGLEAALIVGIVLSFLVRTGRKERIRYAWAGIIGGLLLSLLIALGLRWVGASLETPAEQIFEGTAMLLAAAVLTWMIFWMRLQGHSMKSDLERRVAEAVSRKENWGLLSLTFLAVFREGLETALFLAAAAARSDSVSTLIGAAGGLALAAVAGVLMFQYAVRLNLRLFFNITSVLLIVFAAGLFAHGVHEFQEIGWLPLMSSTAWDTRVWLDDRSPLGSILRSLFGYNDNPSVLEAISYLAYWLAVLLGVRWWNSRLTARLAPRVT